MLFIVISPTSFGTDGTWRWAAILCSDISILMYIYETLDKR